MEFQAAAKHSFSEIAHFCPRILSLNSLVKPLCMALLVAAMRPAQAQRPELRHRCVEGSVGENFGTEPDFVSLGVSMFFVGYPPAITDGTWKYPKTAFFLKSIELNSITKGYLILTIPSHWFRIAFCRFSKAHFGVTFLFLDSALTWTPHFFYSEILIWHYLTDDIRRLLFLHR